MVRCSVLGVQIHTPNFSFTVLFAVQVPTRINIILSRSARTLSPTRERGVKPTNIDSLTTLIN